jgi:hypothetical protein
MGGGNEGQTAEARMLRCSWAESMDVILDTTAMRANSIDGIAFKALREYLRKTRSKLLIPFVVLEELSAQHRLQIQKLERDIDGVRKDLHRLFPSVRATFPTLDTPSALDAYRKRLLSCAEKVQVLDNQPEDLKELVKRLAGRVPPASPSGEEARDVLVWLSLLAVGRTQHVAFVSDDKRAFFKDGKLRPELIRDVSGFESNVEAFCGLDDLLRVHHARSSFIDTQWLEKQIDTKKVSRAIEHFVDEQSDLFSRQVEDKGEPTGYASLIQLVQHEVEDYFVSDVSKNALYVSVTLWSELEVEVEYYPREHEDYPRGPAFLYLYPSVRLQLHLEVVDEKVAKVTVGGMEDA